MSVEDPVKRGVVIEASDQQFPALLDFAALNVIGDAAGEHFIQTTNDQILNSAGTSSHAGEHSYLSKGTCG